MRIHAMMCFVIVLALMTVGTASALSPPIVYVSANNDGDYNCDGVADQVQINAALDYVDANDAYTTVYLKNDGGTNDYIISDQIEIHDDTHFTGASGVRVKLKSGLTENDFEQMVTGGTDLSYRVYNRGYDIEISNIIFDADRYNQSISRMTVRETISIRGNNLTVHDCQFEDGVGDAIKFANYGEELPGIEIYDNEFYISGHCNIYIVYTGYTGDNRVWIHDNNFNEIYSNAGVRLDEVSGALIENNTFFSDTQWSDHGVYISYVNDNGAGTECKDNEVRYNEFHNVREWAILFCARVSSGGTKSETTGNYIHHNMIYEGLGYDDNAGGINVYGMDQAVVEYNTIVDGEGDGVACEEYLNYGLSPTGYTITVENNIIQGMSTYGSHQYGIANHESSSHTINSNYNNIYDCDGGNYLGVTEGGYDTHVDSKFYDATNDIYTLKSTAGVWDGDNWETSAEQSPCIDGADPSDPYSNEPENNGDRANMGRWGNTIYASKSGAAEINVNSADSIQDAVDAATNGDTIIVYPGVYTENVNVYKKLTIISESGNPDDTIVQAASSNDHVFHVTADNVTINGFTATGVTGDDKSGIYLYGVEGCTITNNIASNNDLGIYLYDSSNNLIYNNYFNNTNNTLINDSTGNVWNITKTAGTNIIGGSYLGGNYWAHPNGTGFSQTNNTDADRDGICDETYTIASDHIDYLPLAAPLVYPVADFTANVTEGISPLTVAFTDHSTNATSWAWDVTDNGTVDYTTQYPVHTYTIPGLYTVNLTVSNGNGT
ncbi:parallel beta-helix repeat (two copies), partial [Methanococcoides vulcani]